MIDLDTVPEDFIEALIRDFREHGSEVIERFREQNPLGWLDLISIFALEGLRGRKDDGEKY